MHVIGNHAIPFSRAGKNGSKKGLNRKNLTSVPAIDRIKFFNLPLVRQLTLEQFFVKLELIV